MKILHVISTVSRLSGGLIEGVIQQSRVLSRMDSHCEIVTLDAPEDPWVAECPVKTHAMGVRSPFLRSLKRYMPLLRYGYSPHMVPWLRMNAANYDAIIVNGLWNYSSYAAWKGLKNSSKPYVVFTHGMLDPWFRKEYPLKHVAKQVFWWFSEGRLLRDADAVFFTAEDERVRARNAFWPYRVRECVVGYGTSDVQGDRNAQTEAFRRTVPGIANRDFLLFLSRIHPKKGCDLLIHAYAKVATKYPSLDLVVAGPDQTGWKNALEKLGRDYGIENRIHWPGMLYGDAKWGAFHACEAFILPSHQENFGIVVAEAMACSKPVLITDRVNIWREVNACNGGMVSSDTQKGIDGMLQDFLALPESVKKAMGVAARLGFQEKFEISNAVDNVIKEINNIIAIQRNNA